MPSSQEQWLEMRTNVVTSTEVSALFNLSPYMTSFELWHQKKSGQIPEFKESDRMKWGSRLESAIAKGVADDNGWKVSPLKSFCEVDDLRLGSSFDFKVGSPGIEAILEIKNVDSLIFKEGWTKDDDGNIEAPHHIELQVQHQMLVSGINKAYIAALVGGNEVRLLKRDADENIQKAILDKVAGFWKTIDNNEAPEPDFERDAAVIMKLNQYAEPGKIMEPVNEIDSLALEYKEHSDIMKAAEKKRDAVKAHLITLIGDHEKCKGDSYTISAGVVGEAQVSYTRKAYRNFRINWRKKKNE